MFVVKVPAHHIKDQPQKSLADLVIQLKWHYRHKQFLSCGNFGITTTFSFSSMKERLKRGSEEIKL